jgi:hypothetical protein
VPFVIVFTKFDLVPNASSSHSGYEVRCRSLFRNVPADIVSSIYSFVCVACKGCLTPLFPAQPKFHDLINKLVATTDGVIIAHSRNMSAPSEAQRTQSRLSLVSLAWSVSQRASRDINVQAAIEWVTSLLLLNLLIKLPYCTTELDEAVSKVFLLDKGQFNKVIHPRRILAWALVQ